MANSLDLLTLQQITMAPERLMMVRKQEKIRNRQEGLIEY